MSEAIQRNLTLDLHIKTLCIKVTEHTPVYVIWQRGNKKAKTKSRLLNENVSMAVIDEKFQISTIMEVNEDGVPIKDKMSKLTIAADKGKGVIGEADLNLSEYQENDFKIFKIPLNKCADPDGYIEVGLRATVTKDKTPKAGGGGGNEAPNEQQKDQIVMLIEDLDKEKKNQKKQKGDYDEKIKALNEKVNTLQTNLENTKTDLAYLHKQKKNWDLDKVEKDKEKEKLNRKIVDRERDLADKEYELKKLREQVKDHESQYQKFTSDLEKQKDQKAKELKELGDELEQKKKDLRSLYDFGRFDLGYVADVVIFSKAEPQLLANPNQVVITTPGTRASRGSVRHS